MSSDVIISGVFLWAHSEGTHRRYFHRNSGECGGTFAGTLVNVREVLVNMALWVQVRMEGACAHASDTPWNPLE